MVFLLITWMVARKTEAPFSEVLSYMSLFDKHFQPFTKGAIHTRAIVYYASVTFLALLGTRVVLGKRRWR